MFSVKFFTSAFCKKILPAFVIAFILGITANAFFGRYTIYYSVNETFTKSEAESLVNKKVSVKGFSESGVKAATIRSYQKHETDGAIVLTVEFDEPIMGKYKTLDFDKEIFKKLVAVSEN